MTKQDSPDPGVMLTYAARGPVLQVLASKLEKRVQELLAQVEHVDRIYFRAKDAESFATKSVSRDKMGELKYESPLEDIEDQVAGRILVFFRRDIIRVGEALLTGFNPAEQVHKQPDRHDAFAYESKHFVFIIPPHLEPPGWNELTGKPSTFEVQVRTLFMHAWAEPEHDISYKAKVPLTDEEKRKIAWAAANAWGADEIFEQVLDSLAERVKAEAL